MIARTRIAHPQLAARDPSLRADLVAERERLVATADRAVPRLAPDTG